MKEFFDMTTVGIEVAAVLVLLAGLVLSTVRFIRGAIRGPDRLPAYQAYRRELGRTLLLTLEFLIAADIIYTIAVDQTFTSLGMLGLLVLIRTFLSFSLELEVSGRWPWQGRGEAHAGE